ncbi:MAG TPA: hypothetical protein VLT33_19935, partial [Labilithrix sp.]|nr:hypothetical protein [Labilithrix sp.]
MSKKSSAALAQAIPAARASSASTRRQKVESARSPVADEESSPAVDDEGEEEVAPASTVAEGDAAELVVLEEEFEFEDAAAEVEEGDAPVPTAKKKPASEEGGGDTMLARYFREMATHPVMGPDEELG